MVVVTLRKNDYQLVVDDEKKGKVLADKITAKLCELDDEINHNIPAPYLAILSCMHLLAECEEKQSRSKPELTNTDLKQLEDLAEYVSLLAQRAEKL